MLFVAGSANAIPVLTNKQMNDVNSSIEVGTVFELTVTEKVLINATLVDITGSAGFIDTKASYVSSSNTKDVTSGLRGARIAFIVIGGLAALACGGGGAYKSRRCWGKCKTKK